MTEDEMEKLMEELREEVMKTLKLEAVEAEIDVCEIVFTYITREAFSTNEYRKLDEIAFAYGCDFSFFIHPFTTEEIEVELRFFPLEEEEEEEVDKDE